MRPISLRMERTKLSINRRLTAVARRRGSSASAPVRAKSSVPYHPAQSRVVGLAQLTTTEILKVNVAIKKIQIIAIALNDELDETWVSKILAYITMVVAPATIFFREVSQ